MKIYRIIRQYGGVGTQHYAAIADVLSTGKKAALCAAQEGRVKNWRFNGSWDISNKKYNNYWFVGVVERDLARNPQEPVERPNELPKYLPKKKK